ncbi:phosphopantothenoylcysteine decarboxylase-like [Acanthaster planci]|uniref:Phosphopantothenoylcysteine decarboxylase n=1 Tax=Acanthaster planci TaxID=133434 RepID=A0A8B7ZI76_ACAPL|nr:phosphopantothenoylcysteine decarboxylase-like [Acanthaster planci]XP_022104712.1 phosphopantothenoylcysteine decarboxylase-like [Acanthaster planci]XP_022104714.1 phosphopantothenoylcysteine decarboxylase-like [Acanthaster planci]XP_022104715.1 phosphopantothenoylcysteine decarboxylase-like [Acanthaster planci]XP_022104716.1 phosphopantothenoylcysteine decarboxylase-like [Acanthaster planci]
MAQKEKRVKLEAEHSEATPQSAARSAKQHVLVGCTGSVASIKLPQLVQELLRHEQLQVSVIATENACHFFQASDLPGEVAVYRDADEWSMWKNRDDPVLHIELRRRADLLVIAPLDANTLAKVANGICDNLLTCVVRAWDLAKPLLFCPAMNTHMWNHPITAEQINTLKSLGYSEVPCVEKKLACGDTGAGAMAEVSTIVTAVLDALNR